MLDKESLPEELQSKAEFIEKFIQEYNIDLGEIEGQHHIFCWRINVGNLKSGSEVQEYLEKMTHIISEDLKNRGIACFYFPVINEPTSLTVLDLRTMKYCRM